MKKSKDELISKKEIPILELKRLEIRKKIKQAGILQKLRQNFTKKYNKIQIALEKNKNKKNEFKIYKKELNSILKDYYDSFDLIDEKVIRKINELFKHKKFGERFKKIILIIFYLIEKNITNEEKIFENYYLQNLFKKIVNFDIEKKIKKKRLEKIKKKIKKENFDENHILKISKELLIITTWIKKAIYFLEKKNELKFFLVKYENLKMGREKLILYEKKIIKIFQKLHKKEIKKIIELKNLNEDIKNILNKNENFQNFNKRFKNRKRLKMYKVEIIGESEEFDSSIQCDIFDKNWEKKLIENKIDFEKNKNLEDSNNNDKDFKNTEKNFDKKKSLEDSEKVDLENFVVDEYLGNFIDKNNSEIFEKKKSSKKKINEENLQNEVINDYLQEIKIENNNSQILTNKKLLKNPMNNSIIRNEVINDYLENMLSENYSNNSDKIEKEEFLQKNKEFDKSENNLFRNSFKNYKKLELLLIKKKPKQKFVISEIKNLFYQKKEKDFNLEKSLGENFILKIEKTSKNSFILNYKKNLNFDEKNSKNNLILDFEKKSNKNFRKDLKENLNTYEKKNIFDRKSNSSNFINNLDSDYFSKSGISNYGNNNLNYFDNYMNFDDNSSFIKNFEDSNSLNSENLEEKFFIFKSQKFNFFENFSQPKIDFDNNNLNLGENYSNTNLNKNYQNEKHLKKDDFLNLKNKNILKLENNKKNQSKKFINNKKNLDEEELDKKINLFINQKKVTINQKGNLIKKNSRSKSSINYPNKYYVFHHSKYTQHLYQDFESSVYNPSVDKNNSNEKKYANKKIELLNKNVFNGKKEFYNKNHFKVKSTINGKNDFNKKNIFNIKSSINGKNGFYHKNEFNEKNVFNDKNMLNKQNLLLGRKLTNSKSVNAFEKTNFDKIIRKSVKKYIPNNIEMFI